jgi:thiamine-phosphate pyrophosphorylase
MSFPPAPVLMLVTDRTLTGGIDGLVEQVGLAVAGGINAVQLREKDMDQRDLAALGSELRAALAGRGMLVLNGAPAQALAAGADGVHLPEDGPSAASTKRAAGERLAVGQSVHSVEAAQRAEREGADYIVLGTIFPSRSHPGGATGGLALVEQVARLVRIPVVAIGGITADNAADVIRAGAHGVAVISAILGQPDPRSAARKLRERIDAAWQIRAEGAARLPLSRRRGDRPSRPEGEG